jgi:tight adherence protein B
LAGTDPPASVARLFGIAPAISVKKSVWPQHWMPPKPGWPDHGKRARRASKMTPFMSALLVFAAGAACVAGVLLALMQPCLARSRMARHRLALELAVQPTVAVRSSSTEAKRRRRSIEDTLREMAEKQKVQSVRRNRVALLTRLRQGGLKWSVPIYWSVCAVTGSVTADLLWASFSLGILPALGFGLACGLFLTSSYVSLRRSRRFKQFGAEFPNAVDVIVRGVKSGMPLGDCIRVVAVEGQEPVRSEFKTVIDDQTIGMPMDQALQRLAERVPLPETNFLAIVVAIQSRTGGNLAEALGNLSIVLRERKKMRGKIRAMSAEAKASGGIIGCLPVVVGLLVYLTSPDYIGLLFITTAGNVVLVGCALWMSMGILVMRRMINFDF